MSASASRRSSVPSSADQPTHRATTLIGNTALRLPVEVNLDGLRADLDAASRHGFVAHFNPVEHTGTMLNLRCPQGWVHRVSFAEPSGSERDTEAMELCPNVRALLDSLRCPILMARFLVLEAGQRVHRHIDDELNYAHGLFRLHVPVWTNADATLTVDDTTMHLGAGEVWYVDFDRPHAAHNGGNARRVHLVIDARPSPTTDQLFSEAGYDFAETYDAVAASPEQHAMMVAELERLDLPGARVLLDQMRAQANDSTTSA